jgi:hypothetical protein
MGVPGVAIVMLALCLAWGLLTGPARWFVPPVGTPCEAMERAQHLGANIDAAPARHVSSRAFERAAWHPLRLPSVQPGGSPWRWGSPGSRARQEEYAALVAVQARRLRPGADSRGGLATADQPPIVTRPLRGPPGVSLAA